MSLLSHLFGKSNKPELDYLEGDKVKIIDGALSSFSGIVRIAKTENNRIEVAVDVGKVPVIAELKYNQIEKIKGYT